MKIKVIYITIILILLQKKVADQEITSLEYVPSPLSYAHQDAIHYMIMGEISKFNNPESFYKTFDKHTYSVLILLEDEFFYRVSGVVKPLSPVERMQEAIQA